MIEPPCLRLTFTGDIALGGRFLEKARPEGAALTYPFEPLRETLQDTDILFINLEGPLSTDGPPRLGRTSLLHNDQAILDWLNQFPVAVCCLANNHLSDYGDNPLKFTRELLSKRGILSVGAGANALEAQEPLVFEYRGTRFGVLAFTTDEPHVGSLLADERHPGSCGLPSHDEAASRVRSLAGSVDHVIVMMHSGFEYYDYPAPAQRALTHMLVDAGATLVVGHHPHVQQGLERRGGGLICHSLGNLLLPEMMATTGRIQYRKPYTKQFAMLNVDLTGDELRHFDLIGGRCDRRYRLQPYTGERARRFKKMIERLSGGLKVQSYSDTFDEYSRRRRKQLGRERIKDSIVKLLRHPVVIAKSLSCADWIRGTRRVKSS